MFGSDKKSGNFDTTLISSKAEIVGDIKLTGGLHVDGTITGNVIAEPDSAAVVRISDKGSVKGEIRAPHVVINGRVTGDVISYEHVELAKKAEVNGDVYYSTMEMVMGAKVNGKLLNEVEQQKSTKSLVSRLSGGNNKPSPSVSEEQGGTGDASSLAAEQK